MLFRAVAGTVQLAARSSAPFSPRSSAFSILRTPNPAAFMSTGASQSDHASSVASEPSSLAAGDRPQESSKEEPVEFVALSRSVHVHRPKKGVKRSANSSSSSSPILASISSEGRSLPSVVLINGWMDAPLRIVSKYAAPYAKLFPEATIIIKLSTGLSFAAGKEARLAALKGVVKLLEEVQTSSEARSQLQSQVADLSKSSRQAGLRMDVDSQNRLGEQAEGKDATPVQSNVQDGGLLVHTFSDGGAFNLSQLLRLLPDHKVPPPRTVIFDCSPGQASPRSGSFAFSLPLAKRPLVRAVVRAVIYMYLRLVYTFKWIIGSKTWSEIMRSNLNRIQTWDWAEKQSKTLPPRLYLYSKADALIEWKAVERHAQNAADLQGLSRPLQLSELTKKGTTSKQGEPVVALRRWEKANHCDIGRADFDGYWTAVRTFYEAVL